MQTQKDVVIAQQKKHKKLGTYQLLKNAGYVGGVTAITAMTAPSAFAMAQVGEKFNEELTSGKAILTTIFVGGALMLGFLAAWRYLKRGINSV